MIVRPLAQPRRRSILIRVMGDVADFPVAPIHDLPAIFELGLLDVRTQLMGPFAHLGDGSLPGRGVGSAADLSRLLALTTIGMFR
jgi:hypothetical protein